MAGGDHHMFTKKYLERVGPLHRKGRRIGLIRGNGAIYRGTSGIDPLSGGSSMGPTTLHGIPTGHR